MCDVETAVNIPGEYAISWRAWLVFNKSKQLNWHSSILQHISLVRCSKYVKRVDGLTTSSPRLMLYLMFICKTQRMSEISSISL